MDSSKVIEQILRNGFELKESALTTERLIEMLASSISQLPGKEVKVISLIGGAASGKSTLTRALATILWEQGFSTDAISTDDFNKGNREWRREHFEGKNPPDPTKKYDFELMNRIIKDIKAVGEGEIVPVPVYDEKTGLAVDDEVWPHQIKKVEALIVEGDFHPVEKPNMVIYLHVSDEQRLENRKRRDVGLREGSEQAVVSTFNYRQSNQHFPYTLTYAKDADVIVVADATDSDFWKYSVYRASRNQR